MNWIKKRRHGKNEANKPQGMTPVTLFEIALQGGSEGVQSFYDISLVDGYNLPMGVVYLKSSGAPDLPPNLTNCRCVASEGHTGGGSANESFPMPEASGGDLGRWCPWDHQLSPPTKPGDGVYPYPDDDIKRPNFSPCLSACELTKSDKDCCKGEFNSPDICKPGMYSNQAKAVCPDAYSFAFDDQSSTFIVPTGGGWEVTFCPGGASTNILRTFSKELFDLASGNVGSEDLMEMARHWQTVKVSDGSTTADRERVASLGALVVLVAFAVLW